MEEGGLEGKEEEMEERGWTGHRELSISCMLAIE